MNDTTIDVPGARLRCRLVGEPSDLPLLVFENGSGASYEQWAWIERLLAPQTQLLFYDRAGLGGSTLRAPQTVAGLSSGLAALLTALKIESPVIVVGHSYGGLMGSLHVAQQPQRVRALIQIDATPDCSDPAIDAQLKLIKLIGPLSIGLARLKLANPMFGIAGTMLPAPQGERMMQLSFGNVPSLKAAMAELRLLSEIRSAIAAGPVARPALVISAGRSSEIKGWMARIAPPDKARGLLERMQSQHRQKASRAAPGEWETLPHDHGGLVFDAAGATDTARRMMSYLRSLAAV